MHRLITRKCTPFEKFHSAFRNLVLLSLLRLDLDPWATSLGIRIRTNESGSAVCQFRVSLILRAEPSAIVPSSLKSIFCPLSYSLDSLWITGNVVASFKFIVFLNVMDPDHPKDPYVFGPPGSGLSLFWTDPGLDSDPDPFIIKQKRVIKTLISTV